mgnify:CR=1 FL=1
MNVIEGHHVDVGGRYAIIAARFNELIVERLVDGALDTLRRHGVDVETRVTVIWVPGAVELPVTAARAARSGQFDAIIGIGCVIRGGTPHFDYVAGEAAKGLASVALATGVPVTFGVLTTENIEQAIERAGTKMGNKGHEAALSALEMVSLFKRMDS